MPSTLHSSRRPASSGAAPFPAAQPPLENPARLQIPQTTSPPHAAHASPNAAADEPFLIAPSHRCSTEERQAQDRALHGIISTLFGSTASPARPLHTPYQARNLALHAYHTLGHSAGHHTAPSTRVQQTLLIYWAHKNGLLIQRDHLPAEFQPQDDGTEDSQMEHHVWPDATGHRVIKLTHAGHFGLWPVANRRAWDLHTRAASPARYLSRIEAANLHFADDWILHAIVTDPHHHGHIQFLTSQPAYPGITPGDIVYSAPEPQQNHLRTQQQTLIHRALATQGFHPTTHSPSTFYQPHGNLALFDAHLHNLIWLPTPQGHHLMPFDVILLRPEGRLRQNISQSLISTQPRHPQNSPPRPYPAS